MPQKQLSHHFLTASATVDGNAVNMLTDDNSANALAPLTVKNTHGFELPQTGETGTSWMPIIGGVILALGAVILIYVVYSRRKDEEEQAS